MDRPLKILVDPRHVVGVHLGQLWVQGGDPIGQMVGFSVSHVLPPSVIPDSNDSRERLHSELLADFRLLNSRPIKLVY